MVPPIFQLTYISSARGIIGTKNCQSILAKSRANNSNLNVSGALLFNSKRFLQALEGQENVVRMLYDKIIKDERHSAIVILNERTLDSRQFGAWAMAFDDGSGNHSLRQRTSALLEDTDPSTRALFETTAQIYRQNSAAA